ncbi:terminase gpA endonuclease subunit [Aurantimonas coralicida]|uniref:terminase gpA endonuclease subunit n=1 Tax=Aurantimonas coralicida TaxID=182270 RepID=UPI001D1869E6|nr:terminase gpA endonuclease subunit [Aurantimonas coralicida]MCC4298428.1 phage terminase large subunit family protein [Aurantimonas coralicida]
MRRATRASISEDEDFIGKLFDLTTPGLDEFRGDMFEAADALVPNLPTDIVDWTRANLVLPSSVAGGRGGPLEFSPIQAAIVRMWQEPGVRKVSFKKPPRFGSSLINAAGLLYYACHEGYDVIFYERTDDDAQGFHDKMLFQVMMESTSISAMKRPDGKHGVQDAWSDIILRNGASIQLRSVGKNGSFRQIKGYFIACDEAGAPDWRDKSKNSEGSKLKLVEPRAQQFATPVIYVAGTPTRRGMCTVSEEYEKGDRREYRMPCPRCGEVLAFHPDVRRAPDRQTPMGAGLRYTVDEAGYVNDAWYECGGCGGHIEEREKIGMMEAGSFVKTNVGEPGHASLHIWQAYSTDPGVTWRHVAWEHKGTETDPEALQPFVNLWLADTFEPPVQRVVEISELEKHAESWGDAEAPEWAEYLFAGIDVNEGNDTEKTQKDGRVEIVVVAMGANKRHAVIDHIVIAREEMVDEHGEIRDIYIPPMSTRSEALILEAVTKRYRTQDGRDLGIRRTFMDSGYLNKEVLEFVNSPDAKRAGIRAIRGARELSGRRPLLPIKESYSKQRKKPFFWIGTQVAKDTIGRQIKIPAPAPESWVFAKKFGEAFYRSFLAETLIETQPGVRMWKNLNKKSETGEVWDCVVYAVAAAAWEKRENARVRDVLDRMDELAVQQALSRQAEAAEPKIRSAPEKIAGHPVKRGQETPQTPTDTTAPATGERPRFRLKVLDPGKTRDAGAAVAGVKETPRSHGPVARAEGIW